MPNQFLILKRPFIEKIKRQLMEYHYSGAYGGNLPLLHIVNLFDEMTNEIDRLSRENGDLKEDVNSLEKKYNDALSGFKMKVEDDDEEENK